MPAHGVGAVQSTNAELFSVSHVHVVAGLGARNRAESDEGASCVRKCCASTSVRFARPVREGVAFDGCPLCGWSSAALSLSCERLTA